MKNNLSKKSIAYLVSEGAGIRPINSGISHILNNIKNEEEFKMVLEHANQQAYCCEDWLEFKNALKQINTDK
jgi:hypothetical protein